MKLLIILTLVSVVSTSCMEARNRSSIVGNSSDGAKYAKEYDTSPEDRVGTGLPGFTPTEGENTRMDDDDTTTTLGAPSDATGCATRDTNHLGKITVCKSKTNDLDIYIQVDTVITSTKLCAIPMYEYSGKSIYLGNPRCMFLPDNKYYKLPLLKNRSSSHSQYNMTSVMLIKDMKFNYTAPFATSSNLYGEFNAVDAFLYCSQRLDSTGDGSYCDAFHSINQHVYHSFSKTY